jgi:hypothetical protein
VLTCLATECGHNRQLTCTAPGVIVGRRHPACETYTNESINDDPYEPLVVICMTTMCEFNSELSCVARGVTFDRHEDHAACATFRT